MGILSGPIVSVLKELTLVRAAVSAVRASGLGAVELGFLSR